VKNRNSWFLRCEGWNGLQMPQMSTMKVLVQKSFKFGGFCTWPSLAVWHGLARLLRRVLCEKNEIYDF